MLFVNSGQGKSRCVRAHFCEDAASSLKFFLDPNPQNERAAKTLAEATDANNSAKILRSDQAEICAEGGDGCSQLATAFATETEMRVPSGCRGFDILVCVRRRQRHRAGLAAMTLQLRANQTQFTSSHSPHYPVHWPAVDGGGLGIDLKTVALKRAQFRQQMFRLRAMFGMNEVPEAGSVGDPLGSRPTCAPAWNSGR